MHIERAKPAYLYVQYHDSLLCLGTMYDMTEQSQNMLQKNAGQDIALLQFRLLRRSSACWLLHIAGDPVQYSEVDPPFPQHNT